uniref:Uncharacterized protein n=1 Tax=Avena sativa TaxID=4498 RepID=A0ACD5ZLL3_AVESA
MTHACAVHVVCMIGTSGTCGVALLVLDVMALKSKEDSERDEFISQMLEMNARIRQFQQMASAELAGKSSELSEDGMQGKATNSDQGKATDGHNLSDKNETAESEGMLTDLADKVSNVEAEMHALEEEYQKDLLEHKKICQEVADVRAKGALIEAVMEETKQLQEIGERVAELEKVHNSVAEELQRRYACPGCGTNNMAQMEQEPAASN